MNDSNMIKTLEELDIKLEEGEEVIHIAEYNYNSNHTQFERTIHSGMHYVLMYLVKLNRFISSNNETFSEAIDHFALLRSDLQTVFTDQRLILQSKKNIYWNDVYQVKKFEYYDKNYLIFDLKPYSTYNNEEIIESGSKMIEDSRFIALSVYDNIDEIIKEITPYWLKNGAPKKLLAVKEKLMDTFNMRITRKQNNLEMLTAKYDDFSINYTHRSMFPANVFQVGVKFKQPIPAFLNINEEKLGTRFIKAIGFKDIQVGNEFIDDKLYIQGSHPQEIKNIFSPELNNKLEQLLKKGSFNLSFGEPVNKKQLKRPTTKSSQSEEILDIQLTSNSNEPTAINVKGQTTLSITINIHGESLPEQQIQQFAETVVEVSIHFANGLKNL